MDSDGSFNEFQVFPMRKMNITQIQGEQIINLLDLGSLTLQIHNGSATPTEEKNMTSIFKSLNGKIQCFKVEMDIAKMKDRQYFWPLLSSLDGIQRLAIKFQEGKKPIDFVENKHLAMISTYFSKLISVTHLSLNTSQCQIKTDNEINFSLGIDQLEHLTCLELLLDKGNLDPIQLFQVSQAIGKALKLSILVLKLRGNSILDPRACHLGSSISKLKQLSVLELNLENNSILHFGMNFLFNIISQLQQIKHINISLANNWINCKEIKDKVPFDFSELKHLEVMKLNLKGNNLFDFGVEFIMKGLSTLPNLLTLDLNLKRTCFSISKDNNYKTYCSKLKNLSQLSLTLDNNKLGDSIQFLQAGLSQFHKLTSYSLSIHNNQTGIIGMKSIYQVLPSFVNLKTFNLRDDSNSIVDQLEFPYLKNSFEKLDMLQELTLQASEGSLSDPQAMAILIEISKLSNLKNLTLIFLNNKIREIGLQQLSKTIDQLVQLTHLNITFSNHIQYQDTPQYLISNIAKLQNLESLTCLDLRKKNQIFLKKKLNRLVQFSNLKDF